MTEPPILAARSGDVTTLTLNRPQDLNTITLEMIAELHAALDAARQDGTRVVVLTGTGRAFCAGADLSAFGTEPGASLPFLEQIQALAGRLIDYPMPVIAAINGITMGGGLELALASDLVVASATARIGDGHTNVGVIPGAGGASILPRRVPAAVAKYLVFTGGTMTPDELKTHGLICQVSDPDSLAQDTAALAARLAAKSPLALRTIKATMALAEQEPDPRKALALELAANRDYAFSHDMAEGLEAFAEKREPQFLGR